MKPALCVLLAAAGLAGMAAPATASELTTLYDFCASANCTDGTRPSGVVFDAAGTIYGSTLGGGAHNFGTVFALEPDGTKWKYRLLYSFCSKSNCADGSSPESVVLDTNGALYGVTASGGAGGHGVAFRLAPNADHTRWKLKVLHPFCVQDENCTDGGSPPTGLSYKGQKDGKLYDGTSPLFGVTRNGEPDGGACDTIGCGLAYKVFPKTPKRWAFSVIYRFCPQFDSCPDGWNPIGELLVQNGSSVVGTTTRAGAFNGGTLFKLTKAAGAPLWNESTLHAFCQSSCPDGQIPNARPVMRNNGDIYGTTSSGFPPFSGSLFKIAPDGQETTLYRFCAVDDCRDGRTPGGIVFSSAGEVFGITEYGGGHDIDRNRLGGGTLYKMSGGTHVLLWQFCTSANCADGEYPGGTPIFGANGKLYGTTYEGGAHGGGLVYELAP